MFCRPIGLATDHAYLCFDVNDRCTRDLCDKKESRVARTKIYSGDNCCAVCNGMLDSDPLALHKDCHSQSVKQAQMPLPHTTGNAPNLV